MKTSKDQDEQNGRKEEKKLTSVFVYIWSPKQLRQKVSESVDSFVNTEP